MSLVGEAAAGPGALARRTLRPRPAEADAPSPSSRRLDRFADAGCAPFGCDVPPYLAFGVAGIAAGFGVLALLFEVEAISVALLVPVLVTALTMFSAAGLLRQWIGGEERHVLVVDVLLVLVAVGGLAAAVGADVARVVDATTVGLGVFCLFGRLGCLASGCCHGRPSTFGIRYERGLHADDPLTGVRLFPLQLVEAAWIGVVTSAAAVLALVSSRPGAATSAWLLGYGAGRFVLEFARGDGAGRSFVGPMTTAQATVACLILGVVAYEQVRADRVDVAALVALAASVCVCLAAYAYRSRWLSLDPAVVAVEHIPEWELMLAQLELAAREGVAAQADARCGRGTVRVSLGIDPLEPGFVLHAYSLAGRGWMLSGDEATDLAGVVLQRLPEHEIVRASPCAHGRYQLWVVVNVGTPAGSGLNDDRWSVFMRARAAAREVAYARAAGCVRF